MEEIKYSYMDIAAKYKIISEIINSNDDSVLEAIKELLEKPKSDAILKNKLTSRALKAEEDIKAGRVHTSQEAEAILRSRLGI